MSISFNSVGFALETSEDSIFVDKITINPKHGIVEGEFAQLTATISPDDVSGRMVEWSSSNESVISCTKEGVIKGVSANGYADITCKAKFSNAKDTIRIYCAESIGGYYRDYLNKLFVQIYDQPEISFSSTLYFNFNYIRDFVFEILKETLKHFPYLSPFASSDEEVSFGPCEVRGRYGKFAYVAVETQSGITDGFVKFTKLKKESNYFLSLSAEDIDVWANGYSYPNCKLTTQYKGAVKWDVTDDTIVEFDDQTGQITAHKPGRTTITATAGEMKRTCTIHALYRWPQLWTAKTNQDTSLYKAKGTGYVANKDLAAGKNFVVWGDDGSSEGWAYGKVEGTDYWGYIPISHISTKGTVWQYSNMKTTLKDGTRSSWIWPIRDVKGGQIQTIRGRYISSPYGWRDSKPIRHKGIDITNSISSAENFAKSIDGYEVVSAFKGRVIFVNDFYENNDALCGNCVAIRSEEKDPVSGKYLVAIYMHLKYKPKVVENQVVSANELLGYVGNTGNSEGSHLHFEVNNQSLSYDEHLYYDPAKKHEKVFSIVINPAFFYLDYINLPITNPHRIVINEDCEAMNYRKPFWYGDDIKEEKKP